ncbi:MAG: ABC transporter ATP-binding protein/permease [Bacilli bacterium]|nr:ABC transporter ATP-binding protein/permease [Bacilli bacterium]
MNNFEEHDYNNEKISLGVWKKIIKLVFKSRKHVILMMVFVFFLTVLDIIYPLLNKYALDHFFNDNPDFSTKYLFIGAYILVAVGFLITVWGFIKMAGVVEVEVGYELRDEAFKNLQVLPFSYYDKTPAGWIMARLTSDSRKLATIISWGLVDLLWGILSMIGIISVMFFINWRLGLIIVGLLPILLVVSIYFRRKILFAYRDVRKTNSKITASYNEGILGNKTTKTLTLETKKEIDFNKLAHEMRSSSIKAVVRSAIFFPVILVISYFGVMMILGIGGDFVINAKYAFTVPLLYLFVSYTTSFFEPVMQVARILAELQQAQASAERIMALIETKPEIFDREDVVEKYGTILEPIRENFEELIGDIEFRNVTFRYNEKETILENFNLKIKSGTSVALVGSTGSGKSTIVNLICRFYEPVEGQILIDGRDYKDRSITWLHENLGYVLQSPHLFNGSIMENIRYGRLDATDEEVKEAAKLAYVDQFVKDLADGYNTLVGEGGSKLSVGERQLISFARALVANPRILVLDEATSSIDTKTEEVIQDVVKTILKGRTSFIVAHRLSTIINSDLILVIDNGKILESGTHRELLDLRGEYYNLYKNQFINEKIASSAK